MDWILSLLLATVRLAIPVLLISLAELYGQRAGMVNIGLEGLASIGALVGFLVCYVTGSNWLGLLCGALAGILVNMIYAFSTVTLCADHTVYGMAVNIFAPALASFIYRVYFGTGSDLKQITTMASIAIPGLKDIPVIGPLLFDQSPMVYLTFVLVIVTAVFFGKTRAGLSYKSVGEHPQAAATLGINVIGVKYLACVICGALAGIGGAYLTTCYSSTYTDGIVAGRGFIALAAVIFGRWNAGGILLACLFFGFCDALQIRLQVSGIAIPYQFFQMIPYVATVVVLSLIGTRQAGPKANGKTYKVAMICDSSINDGGWGAACYNAMVAAAEKKGWQTEVTDSISQDSYYDSIVAYCALGYDMIYAPGNQYTDAVLQAAEEYPDVAFALLNGAVDTPEKAVNKNVSSLLPNAQQIGWIAGALAGLMTETGKLGFIGGMELDTTKGKIAGFEEAAKYVAEQEGKTVELLNVPYANSFSDAPKGKEFATELISQGADVFFGDASAVDSGAREAIDAANAAAGEIKIYDIGQPADILGQNECIICSQVTDNSAMVVASMEAVEAGTFGGETLYGTLQNGTLSAGALSDLVPADVQEKYLGYIEQMKADTFMK